MALPFWISLRPLCRKNCRLKPFLFHSKANLSPFGEKTPLRSIFLKAQVRLLPRSPRIWRFAVIVGENLYDHDFITRHIGPGDADVFAMLNVTGHASLDAASPRKDPAYSRSATAARSSRNSWSVGPGKIVSDNWTCVPGTKMPPPRVG